MEKQYTIIQDSEDPNEKIVQIKEMVVVETVSLKQLESRKTSLLAELAKIDNQIIELQPVLNS